ncbi:MAG: hypothetical protein LBR27_07915 [Bifidobacteriaceae bacterium]|jgi:N,N'-diacetylchitobiose phosphorylase|nr:hypothetical protein [Bifidobacteriaceae bacterium]
MRYGHFDTEAHEYVIDQVDLPASWINYLGTKDWCTVINQTAGGYSFYRSSERGRVTRFRPNGLPKDRPGHYVYLRDAADGDFWSVSWQPVGKPLASGAAAADGAPVADGVATARYRTRHGLGYSVFESAYRGIEATQRVFVPLQDDLELWDVTVTNTGDLPRRLSLFGYVEFSFHNVAIDNENFQMSLYASGADYADGIIQEDFYYEPWTYHYFTATTQPAGFDCRREAFIGPWADETSPAAVVAGTCTGSEGTTQNHCGALQHDIDLAPGQTVRLAYLLGYGSRDVGATMRDKYAAEGAVDAAFQALRDYWQAKRETLAVATPSDTFNTMVGTWNLFQAETCVVWSRFASFVEVGGRTGLGYRDTAQDLMSVPHTNPEAVRGRIWQLLRGQMSEGYGLHLFDPDLFAENQRADIPPGVKLPTVLPSTDQEQLHGLEDACSDDHLWLVPSVLQYVKETGDAAFLDQVVRFADGGEGTIYEHLVRAVEFTARQVGPNAIAKGLRADWNDCLNLGGGQSALVTFLHIWALRALAEVAGHLGRSADAERFTQWAAQFTDAANAALWDGDWYLRGFTAQGARIGSHLDAQGQIFLEHMPWAVISGAAPRERAEAAMAAVKQHLASPYGTHLLWPSYTTVDDSVGYVTRVYPGVKENGAIFCHPNAWPIIAEARLGHGDQAWEYWETMAPARFNDQAEVRVAEPYVYCQFIYGRDHALYGRAENPWLTGTAGWMYTAATQYILGVRPGYDALVIDPCVPAAWDGFTVQRRWRGGTFHITVSNPGNVCCGVAAVVVDGVAVDPVPDAALERAVAVLPVPEPGRVYDVEVTLG